MMEFSDLKGKTLVRAVNISDEQIQFEDADGHEYRLYHSQDCCESVYVESIVGNLADLIGSPLLMAEQVCNDNEGEKLSEYHDDYQWTFYKLATIKGSVTIRFYGTSNGYYSTGVDFEEVK